MDELASRGVIHAEFVTIDAFLDDSSALVEKRFKSNLEIKLIQHPTFSHRHYKALSVNALCSLLNDGKSEYFDFIYVDGSHKSPDTLTDAVLCFHALRVGGVMVLDDYAWRYGQTLSGDFLDVPKLAIDSFVNCFWNKIEIIHGFPIYQIYIRKTKS